MIDFHPVTLADRAWTEPILFSAGLRSCDNTFPVMYTWQEAYGNRVAYMDGYVLGQMCSRYGTVYLWPIGRGDIRPVLGALRDDAAHRGVPFQLVCVTPANIVELEELFPGRFQFEPYRDAFDYVYDIDRLADLVGKKLHAKRNHINRFTENNPDWSAHPITRKNLSQCRVIDQRWRAVSGTSVTGHEADDEKYEDKALTKAIEDFIPLGLEGLLLLTGDTPVAFAIGSWASEESYNIHFEKADASVQGSYAMVNREYARWIRETYPSVRYINREDDMGVEGLRRAKESYYPDLMIEKHTATWIG